MPSAKAVLESLRPRAEERFEALRRQSCQNLRSLQPVEQEALPMAPKQASLCVYRDVLAGGELRVVVQLFVRGLLGSARIWVRGFRLSEGSEPVSCREDELYDFT
jgi:hypothetical protein